MRKIYWIFIISLCFFLISFFTISDYNVNWDEPVHFMRGQAYLRYFLTGQKNYEKLPLFKEFQGYLRNRRQKPENAFPRYSLYQNDALDGNYFWENDGGHPPLNGILASLTNYIFYQKLGIIGDIEGYHLFIILVSAVLVFLVFYWSYKEYGFFSGLIAFLSLSLYPLFFGESHNNIKDPVETCFFALTIFGFYKGITGKSWRWIVFSSLFCGLALGTKFNILFVPFIIFPWLILQIKTLKFSKKIILSLVFYPLVVFAIFFATWPYLWSDPFFRILSTLRYYKQMGGSGVKSQPPSFYFNGFNTYPVKTVIFITPLVILFFCLIGVIFTIFLFREERQKTSFLWLLWLLVPILRVTLPGTSIYGGVRQIMEYIPAMALLAGFGAEKLRQFITQKFSIIRIHYPLIIFSFLPLALKIISIHPNQNLYFNSLIGGLKGAVARDFPGWGAALGNPYLQGVEWLNQNAELNSKLVLSSGLMTNVPMTKIRPDIEYANNLASTILRDGEYIMGLTYYGVSPFYETLYPERYLIPVYEKKVEGVPILKIWKNDLAHTKEGFVEEKDITSETKMTVMNYGLLLDFQRPFFLTRLELFFEEKSCQQMEEGVISTSLDGVSWKQETEGLLQLQIPRIKKVEKGKITHLFAALPACYLRVEIIPHNSCRFNKFKINVLRDLIP